MPAHRAGQAYTTAPPLRQARPGDGNRLGRRYQRAAGRRGDTTTADDYSNGSDPGRQSARFRWQSFRPWSVRPIDQFCSLCRRSSPEVCHKRIRLRDAR